MGSVKAHMGGGAPGLQNSVAGGAEWLQPLGRLGRNGEERVQALRNDLGDKAVWLGWGGRVSADTCGVPALPQCRGPV